MLTFRCLGRSPALLPGLAVSGACVLPTTASIAVVGGLRGGVAPGLRHGRGFAASSGASNPEQQQKSGTQPGRETDIVESSEGFDAITDKIPQRPVTVVEGTSYTLVIVAALGFAAAVVYAAASELLLHPKEYVCYNTALDYIKDDPRVTVRLGTPVSAYGTESRNRAARQRIPHRIYNDALGREHVQVQFQMKGPSGRATVNADMYKDPASGSDDWLYAFLYMDVESPVPQQVVFVRPGATE